MLLSSICACVGQLFWKLSADQGFWIAVIGFGFYGAGALIMLIAYRYGSLSVLQPMLSMNYVLEPGLYIGGVLYLIAALIDIYVLRYLDYSVALPFTAITYIWTMLLACGILKEKATKKKIAGVGLIIAGAILVAI